MICMVVIFTTKVQLCACAQRRGSREKKAMAMQACRSRFSFPALFIRPSCLLLQPRRMVGLLTRLRLVDNTENAKKVTRLDRPYCIKLPKNSRVAGFGEVITIAHLGKVHKALIVSNRMPSKRLPRYDTHNIILLNEKLEPVGTRIMGPVPSVIRKRNRELSKVIAIATKFI